MIIIAGVRAAASIVNMLLLAYVVTLLFTPFFLWLRKKHIPSLLAIIFILLSLVVVTQALIWLYPLLYVLAVVLMMRYFF